MNIPNVTISLNYTVPVQDAPALLQQLLAALPSGATMTSAGTTEVVRTWPSIPETPGEEFLARAEDNLRRLKDGEIPESGWGNVKDLVGAINSLRPAPRKVVLRAIENGGHITRDEVYSVIGRDSDKTLKGFTKPTARLTKKLKAAGELPLDAKELLDPIYKDSETFQRAQGFAVPLQVVSLMTQRPAPTN